MNSFRVKQGRSLIVNFRLYSLHPRQRIWWGLVPGTEKPPASVRLPHQGHHGRAPCGPDGRLPGKGQCGTPSRHKGFETRFGAGLGGQLSHAASCHWAHPTFPSPAKGAPRGPGCLPAPGFVCTALGLSVELVGPCGLGHLCSSASFPTPWPLVGIWSVSPLTWTLHLCGLRKHPPTQP